MVLINAFEPFLYKIDLETNTYEDLPLYWLIFIPSVIYMISVVNSIIKINASVVVVAVMLFITSAVMGYLMPGIASTLLFLSVALVFIHIHVMRFSFYDEDERD